MTEADFWSWTNATRRASGADKDAHMHTWRERASASPSHANEPSLALSLHCCLIDSPIRPFACHLIVINSAQ